MWKNFKKVTLFMLFLLQPYFVYSAGVIERLTFEGKINNNDITMILDIRENEVSGYYSFNGSKERMLLQGELINGHLTLVENENGVVTGKIEALSDDNSIYFGRWFLDDQYDFYAKAKSKRLNEIVKEFQINQNDMSSGNITIEFIFYDETTQTLNVNIIEDNFHIIVEDVDFDGYPDIRVSDSLGHVNLNYSYYLFNDETNKYILSDLLSTYMISPKVIYKNKILAGFSRDGCCHYMITVFNNSVLQQASYDYLKQNGELKIINLIDEENKTVVLNKESFENEFLILFEN